MRFLASATAALLGLMVLACLGDTPRAPDLEIHEVVDDTECFDCETVEILNAYVDSPFLIRRGAAIRIAASDMDAVVPVRVEDKIRKQIVWVARIRLRQEAAQELREFSRSAKSGRFVAFKILGAVIDVTLVEHLPAVLEVGNFDSSEKLRSAFPSASREELSRVLEPDPEFDAIMSRFERELEEDRQLHEEAGVLIDKLEDAGPSD